MWKTWMTRKNIVYVSDAEIWPDSLFKVWQVNLYSDTESIFHSLIYELDRRLWQLDKDDERDVHLTEAFTYTDPRAAS